MNGSALLSVCENGNKLCRDASSKLVHQRNDMAGC